MSKGYFWDETLTICFKDVFVYWIFLYSKLDCFKMDFPKKIFEAMTKGYFWDEALTIVLKTFSVSLHFPVLQIGLFSKWIFQKKN